MHQTNEQGIDKAATEQGETGASGPLAEASSYSRSVNLLDDFSHGDAGSLFGKGSQQTWERLERLWANLAPDPVTGLAKPVYREAFFLGLIMAAGEDCWQLRQFAVWQAEKNGVRFDDVPYGGGWLREASADVAVQRLFSDYLNPDQVQEWWHQFYEKTVVRLADRPRWSLLKGRIRRQLGSWAEKEAKRQARYFRIGVNEDRPDDAGSHAIVARTLQPEQRVIVREELEREASISAAAAQAIMAHIATFRPSEQAVIALKFAQDVGEVPYRVSEAARDYSWQKGLSAAGTVIDRLCRQADDWKDWSDREVAAELGLDGKNPANAYARAKSNAWKRLMLAMFEAEPRLGTRFVDEASLPPGTDPIAALRKIRTGNAWALIVRSRRA